MCPGYLLAFRAPLPPPVEKVPAPLDGCLGTASCDCLESTAKPPGPDKRHADKPIETMSGAVPKFLKVEDAVEPCHQTPSRLFFSKYRNFWMPSFI